jgi:hypothetical protein
MTSTELKENLIKQYNETVDNLRRLEGAIAACDQLTEAEKTTTEEEEDTDA